ncbi:MAG: hypothetical protein EOL95_09725 [Bacteroidia bacterium]|nr:hypothetical protein [Bacteroidia bacterium]
MASPEDIERFIKNISLPTALTESLSRDIRLSFDFGVQAVEKVINQNILEINPEVIQFLENYNFDLVKGLNETLANQLRDTLKRGIINGDNSRVIAKDIKKIFETTKHRAEMIARTETARAYNFGALKAAESANVELLKYYSAVLDDRTSAICRRLSKKYSKDNAIPIDKEFIDKESGWRGLYPPAHVGCRSEAIYITKKHYPL